MCRRLGWVPPGNEPGMFHVLPLVLQANGGQPEWFHIPKDLILEVEISHPQYVCRDRPGKETLALLLLKPNNA